MRTLLRRGRPLVSSALSRTEVIRALLALGNAAVQVGHAVLAGMAFVRINDRIIRTASELMPVELRSLEAIHLASAQQFDTDLRRVVTYHERVIDSARALGVRTASPR
jgi:hypothetical protein